MTQSKFPAVAVVGVSALFPGSINAGVFWKNILEGQDLFSDVPETHWLIEDYYDPDPTTPDKTYARRGGFLPDVDFSPMDFGVPPNIVPATDTVQLLALGVAKEVLDDASQGQFASMDRDKISVVLGVASATELVAHMSSRLQQPMWERALRSSGLPEDQVKQISERILATYTPWQESTFPGLLGNVVAGRIANRLDLGGTNCVVDAACASSLAALEIGINELYLGQSDLVITGGVDTLNDILMFMCFSKTPALSPSGDCRPFSDQADGTMLGEGIGMIAMKRLEDAERDGDRIYAVVRGVGTSSDGRAKSIYAPVAQGQAKALRRAYDNAGYGPDTVELVEAHGTGTKAGDAAEFGGLETVFDEFGREDRQWCALGSVKSQIGHTKASAGAAGLFKVVMSLAQRALPPTIKVDKPNPKLNIEQTAFYLNTEARPWIRDSSHPRRASVSSFGFGGTNFHITLEEYTGPGKQAHKLRTLPVELFTFSAQDPQALAKQLKELPAPLRAKYNDELFTFLAADSCKRFDAKAPARLAILAKDAAELAARIEQAQKHLNSQPDKALSSPQGIEYRFGAPVEGKVAFLFPGQGSQYVNMGAQWAIHVDGVRQAWDRVASMNLTPQDEQLHQVVYPVPVFSQEDRDAQQAYLTQTQWAQPAIGAVSLGAYHWLKALGLEPDMVGGHSYGEVMALYAAGVLDEPSMMRVSRKRGELMAQAASQTPGTMTAVVAGREQLEALLEQWQLPVTIANHNSPNQVVLSGAVDAIEQVEAKLGGEQITFKRLQVATAFHSPIVESSVEPFAKFLEEIRFGDAKLPVFANSEAAPYGDSSDAKRQTLSGQIARGVRFVEQIEAMHAQGATIFVEVGPGQVLGGLTRRILKDQPIEVISLDQKNQHGMTAAFKALAQLAVAGVSLDLKALWDGYRELEDPRQIKRPALLIPLNGANYGKPHPRDLEKLPKFIKPAAPVAAAPVASKAPTQPVQSAAPVKSVTPPPVMAQPAPKPAPAPVNSAPKTTAPSVRNGSVNAKSKPMSNNHQPSSAWLEAFERLQETTARTHQEYQRLSAENHMAFLEMADTSLRALLGGDVSARGASPSTLMSAPAPREIFAPQPQAAIEYAQAPTPVAQPAPRAAQLNGAASHAPAYTPAPVVAPAPKPAAPVAAAPAPVAKPVAAPAPKPAAPVAPAPKAAGVNLVQIMLEVVSEKTGYPTEMLDLGMELESELGVDSIKRVEILSAMQERVPSLPEVDTATMASLVTLKEIVDYMQGLLGGAPAPAAAPAQQASAPAAPKAAASSPSVNLVQIMLEVVSEKTGYPTEMLDLGMELESELGVDSIKRVEILSAMQERVPSLPEVDTATMASLVTLKEIVDYMQGLLGGAPVEAQAEAPAASGGSDVNLVQIMLEVVSEKTGYPTEMLDLGMELESELGVDSIKRVEILSAMQERVPSLPEVDTATMASLVTLQEIVDYMQSLLGKTEASRQARPVTPSNQLTESVSGQTAGAVVPASEVARYVVEAIDSPANGFAMSGLVNAPEIEIIDDATGVAPALAGLFAESGWSARVVASPSNTPSAVIDLTGLRAEGTLADELALNGQTFDVASACAAHMSEHGGLYVTVQSTGGDFNLSGQAGIRAWRAGASGLLKTLAQEWPGVSAKAIDIEADKLSVDDTAQRIFQELLYGGSQLEVGLKADGRRLALEGQAIALEGVMPDPLHVGAQDVIVVSGGARGVTAASVVALARHTKARFVLLGRTALSEEDPSLASFVTEADLKRGMMQAALGRGEKLTPKELSSRVWAVLADREIRETLAQIDAVGAQARYVSVDVRDLNSLNAAFDEVRQQWGPITGLVHGAGVLADALLTKKTRDQFNRVFETKVDGLRILLEATAQDKLKILCMFSSVAARSGNMGQCDYAMANEVLNKVAHSEAARRGVSCVVKSLGWGPWEAGMVTPALKAMFEARGIALIPLEGGAESFAYELLSMASPVELVMGGAVTAQGLQPPLSEQGARAQIFVHEQHQPFLNSHRIQGKAVLPVVLVMEWFARHAESLRPGLKVQSCEDMRVLRGIVLERFEEDGHWLTVEARQSATQSNMLELLLLDEQGQRRFSGRVILGSASAQAPAEQISSGKSQGQAPWGAVAEMYAEQTLFHGPEFQVIDAISGYDDQGAMATLQGTLGKSWANEALVTDPALIDGALQVALLWGLRALGKQSLPLGVKRYRRYQGQAQGPVTCQLVSVDVNKQRTLTDIRLTDASGHLVADLKGVEMFMVPTGTA